MADRADPLAPPPGYGESPAGATPQDTLCDVRPTPLTRCGKPRACVMWFGCEREHVGPVDVCGAHQAVVRAASLVCGPCARSGEHRVSTLIREDPA